MPHYDIAFAEKLSQVANLVVVDGIEEIEAQRTVLYLSLLSTEISLKAMLEKAGRPVTEIRSRSHDLAKLLKDLDQCKVNAEIAAGKTSVVSASRIRAITLQHGDAEITVGTVLDTKPGDTSHYPNEVRYGFGIRHYPATTIAQLSAKLITFAINNWSGLHMR